MKSTNFLSAALIVAVTAISFNVQAADMDAGAEAKTEAPAATVKKTEHKKKMKPHNHVEAKGGVVSEKAADKASVEKASEEKTNSMDMQKHSHPRDGK